MCVLLRRRARRASSPCRSHIANTSTPLFCGSCKASKSHQHNSHSLQSAVALCLGAASAHQQHDMAPTTNKQRKTVRAVQPQWNKALTLLASSPPNMQGTGTIAATTGFVMSPLHIWAPLHSTNSQGAACVQTAELKRCPASTACQQNINQAATRRFYSWADTAIGHSHTRTTRALMCQSAGHFQH